jgi:hypothetical protein
MREFHRVASTDNSTVVYVCFINVCCSIQIQGDFQFYEQVGIANANVKRTFCTVIDCELLNSA